MTNKDAILEAVSLRKVFHTGGVFNRKTVIAADGVSLALRPRHAVALVGQSGSGKSTMIRMLAKLYDPTDGSILYEGEDVTTKRGRRDIFAYRSKVQMIFQDPFGSLNSTQKVDYHLRRPLRLHGKVKNSRDERLRIGELLERVSLTPVDEFAKKYPHQLSGGQRQRVAIARALAIEPRVILADEPVSMLDVSIRISILNLMAKLRDEENIAFLFVTHDLSSARYFSDEILIMHRGKIVERGPSGDVIENPQDDYTRLLLSSIADPSRVF